MKKLLLCVLLGIVIVGCSSKPKVTLNPVEELPYVFYEYELNKETATITKIESIEITDDLKDTIERKDKNLNANQINSLKENYNLLVFTIEAKENGNDKNLTAFKKLIPNTFKNISFVIGEELLETSSISMGDIYYLDEQTVAILLSKDVAENKDVQIKYLAKEKTIYFNIEH